MERIGDPLRIGPAALGKIDTPAARNTRQISDPLRREGTRNTMRHSERTQQRLVPLASLRSARVPGEFRPSF